MVSVLRNVDEGLARRVADGLGIAGVEAQPRALEPPVTSEVQRSPALSLRHYPGDGSTRGARVALLVADGVEGASLRAIYDALAQAQAAPRFVGVKLGAVTCDGGESIEVEATFETMPAALWDAVVLPGGALADARLADVGLAVEFVKDQYRHCKPMLVLGGESTLLEAAGVAMAEADAPVDPGIVLLDATRPAAADVAVDTDDGNLEDARSTLDPVPSLRDTGRAAQAFLIALGRHKHYERERDPAPV
jgi:catalase